MWNINRKVKSNNEKSWWKLNTFLMSFVCVKFSHSLFGFHLYISMLFSIFFFSLFFFLFLLLPRSIDSFCLFFLLLFSLCFFFSFHAMLCSVLYCYSLTIHQISDEVVDNYNLKRQKRKKGKEKWRKKRQTLRSSLIQIAESKSSWNSWECSSLIFLRSFLPISLAFPFMLTRCTCWNHFLL